MNQIMNASEGITDGQIENAVAKLRDALRKHRGEFPSNASQQVLGVENLGMELLAPFRHRVETVRLIVVRQVIVDRSRTPQEVVNATGRKQSVDGDILATMPQGEGEIMHVHFVPTRCRLSVKEVGAFLAQYGLVSDPRAQAAVNEADPAFADDHPNGSQWGDNCCLMFDRWDGKRAVRGNRGRHTWRRIWWMGGVPASRR